jgi:L1 cell adhesion molecule like protein
VQVLATDGDTHLGGQDFDTKLLELCYSDIKTRYPNMRFAAREPRATARLRVACEQAKRDLSVMTETTVNVNAFLSSDKDYDMKITRAKFDNMCLGLFKGTLDSVKEVLACSGLQKEDIDDVILVGGSTRIPLIQKLVKDYFDGKQPLTNVNPDEAVAYGAAVLAQGMSDGSSFQLLDVTSLALGVEVHGRLMSTMVKKNAPIPTKESDCFTTVSKNQETIEFKVYEGQMSWTKFNKLLGSFCIDVPPAPARKPDVDVTFEIDANGILKVSAVDRATGNASSITIGKDRVWSSREEVQRMMDESRCFEKRAMDLVKNSARKALLKTEQLIAKKSSPRLKQALQTPLAQFVEQFNQLETNRGTKTSDYKKLGRELLTFIKECS